VVREVFMAVSREGIGTSFNRREERKSEEGEEGRGSGLAGSVRA
jgi:hypothetical protein